MNDIEIGERGFHHQNICAFLNIQCDFSKCLFGVRCVHLIGASVAKLRRGFSGFAKRPVESGCIFRGIRHDWDVFVSALVQRLADCTDAAVHHIRWCDDIGTGARVRKALFDEEFHRPVVLHLPCLNDAAMPVVCVFAEANVGDDEQGWHCILNRADCLLDNSIVGVCLGTQRVLFLRDSKQDGAGNTEGC